MSQCKHKAIEVEPPEPDVGIFGYNIWCRDCGAPALAFEEKYDDGDEWITGFEVTEWGPRFEGDPIFSQGVYSWESQERQYPDDGPPGLSYYEGRIPQDGEKYVDCLLWRDAEGGLVGILNHYPFDFPPYEKKHNVNVWVNPTAQRLGVGSHLVLAAQERWPEIDWDFQRYSLSGAALMNELDRRDLLTVKENRDG